MFLQSNLKIKPEQERLYRSSSARTKEQKTKHTGLRRALTKTASIQTKYKNQQNAITSSTGFTNIYQSGKTIKCQKDDPKFRKNNNSRKRCAVDENHNFTAFCRSQTFPEYETKTNMLLQQYCI